MKKDKEWLKGKIKAFQEGENMFTAEFNAGVQDALEYVQELIDQLDEPEQTDINVGLSKPIIPKFVADYIEQSKKDNDGINQVFAFIGDKEDKDLWHWLFPSLYEEKRANQEVFMRAWLGGYEAEKEKLYRIKFSDNQYASRFNDGKINSILTDEELAAQYTEAEIKAIDKRYWVFAEEVKE